MKIKQRVALAAAGVLGLVGLCTGVVYAAYVNQTVRGTTDHSIYKAGNTIDVSGTVNGDIFCVGQTVTIHATVNGDVLCAGQEVTVDGTVNGSVRLAGQTVTLGAHVTHSASVAAQNATIGGEASVGTDVSLAAQTATVDGSVGRDLTGAGQSVAVGNAVGRNALLRVDVLNLNSGAAIAGNLTYTSSHLLQRSGGGHVTGTILRHKVNPERRRAWGGFSWIKLFWLGAMIVLGVVLTALFPRAFRRWSPKWGAGFWWALLTGFVAMFMVPIAIVALMATLVGIPLAILLLLLWLAAGLAAMPLAAYFTGSLIAPKLHPVLIVLLGGVLLGVLQFIPVLGWIVGFVVYWVGTGMLLRGVVRHYPKPVYDENSKAPLEEKQP